MNQMNQTIMLTEAIACLSTPRPSYIRTCSSPLVKPCQRFLWGYIFLIAYAHASAAYAFAQLPPHWYTILINFVLYIWAGFSVIAGSHRLWSHKSYKASWPLRLFLTIGHGFAFQFSVYKWVWMHRNHHKFTDTDADPHNSKRGFFYSHIGWLMLQLHEEVLQKKQTIDLSDLEQDWMVMLQYRLHRVIGPLSCFVLPTVVPFYIWEEDLLTAWNFSMLRWVLLAHGIFTINSLSHMWGTRPYNSNISPSNNVLVSILSFGEGSHNYHHVFPWDYKTAESKSYLFNVTLLFLDLCSKLGLAYDFKEASPEMIQKRKLRTGDGGTEPQRSQSQVRGLEDEDMYEEEKKMVKSMFTQKKK